MYTHLLFGMSWFRMGKREKESQSVGRGLNPCKAVGWWKYFRGVTLVYVTGSLVPCSWNHTPTDVRFDTFSVGVRKRLYHLHLGLSWEVQKRFTEQQRCCNEGCVFTFETSWNEKLVNTLYFICLKVMTTMFLDMWLDSWWLVWTALVIHKPAAFKETAYYGN